MTKTVQNDYFQRSQFLVDNLSFAEEMGIRNKLGAAVEWRYRIRKYKVLDTSAFRYFLGAVCFEEMDGALYLKHPMFEEISRKVLQIAAHQARILRCRAEKEKVSNLFNIVWDNLIEQGVSPVTAQVVMDTDEGKEAKRIMDAAQIALELAEEDFFKSDLPLVAKQTMGWKQRESLF